MVTVIRENIYYFTILLKYKERKLIFHQILYFGLIWHVLVRVQPSRAVLISLSYLDRDYHCYQTQTTQSQRSNKLGIN